MTTDVEAYRLALINKIQAMKLNLANFGYASDSLQEAKAYNEGLDAVLEMLRRPSEDGEAKG